MSAAQKWAALSAEERDDVLQALREGRTSALGCAMDAKEEGDQESVELYRKLARAHSVAIGLLRSVKRTGGRCALRST